MSRLLKILLSQNSLRKALGFNNFFSATKFNHHLEINPSLNFKKVLVLAPHPDDDVFGCGGTITQLAKAGAKISVVYFCDGSGGLPEKSYQKFEIKDDKEELGQNIKRDPKLVEVRKAEAKKSAEILGIKNQIFFGYFDGKLAAGLAVKKAFNDLIKEVNPDIILTPSFLDNHPDHRATNEVLINCSRATVKDNLTIWAYEVWTPIFINRLLDINKEIDQKKKAISAHQSQLKCRNFDQAILALNQYRAEINDVSGFAEGFFATTLEIYRKLYQKS